MNIFLPHDVREVVLIPFFPLGIREDDILLEGVGEDNTMAVEGASRRLAVGKSLLAVGEKPPTSVGNGNAFSGPPYQINRNAIPYAISLCGKSFHSSTAAGVRSACVRTAVLQNGMYKNGEEYDFAVSQDPIVYKKWFKNHELTARNTSSVRMTCL